MSASVADVTKMASYQASFDCWTMQTKAQRRYGVTQPKTLISISHPSQGVNSRDIGHLQVDSQTELSPFYFSRSQSRKIESRTVLEYVIARREQRGQNLKITTVGVILTVHRGNKMPTRSNRGFYCRSYCLLNMFRASLRPSSGAQEYYTVVAACGISCCGFQVADLMWS